MKVDGIEVEVEVEVEKYNNDRRSLIKSLSTISLCISFTCSRREEKTSFIRVLVCEA